MTNELRPRSDFPRQLTWNLEPFFPEAFRHSAHRAVIGAIEALESLGKPPDETIAIETALGSLVRAQAAELPLNKLIAHGELTCFVDSGAEGVTAVIEQLRALPERLQQARLLLINKMDHQGDKAELLKRLAPYADRDPSRLPGKSGAEFIQVATSFNLRLEQSATSAMAAVTASSDRAQRRAAHKRLLENARAHENEAASVFNTLAARLLREAQDAGAVSIISHQMKLSGMPPDLHYLMVSAARAQSDIIARIFERRRQILALPQLEMFDTMRPLEPEGQFDPWSERQASELVISAGAVLGPRYSSLVSSYLSPDARFVDWPNNRGKQPSPSCFLFAGTPFVSLPFDGSFDSVVKLAHEIGHAMYWLLSRTSNNPLPDSAFANEVTAAVSELLLTQFLLATAPSSEHSGFYRQQAFLKWVSRIFLGSLSAEFELRAYELFEKSGGAGVSAQELAAI
jgi:hypothetical protein